MTPIPMAEKASPSYRIGILSPDVNVMEMRKAYLDPHKVGAAHVCALRLPQAPGGKKLTAAQLREWFALEAGPALEAHGVGYLLVADADAFKTIARVSKAEASLGYVLPSDLGPWQALYVPNYRTLWRDPQKIGAKIAQCVDAVRAHATGSYKPPGDGIIRSAQYPEGYDAIRKALVSLHRHPELTVDVEAFSLKAQTAGLGTISFSWNTGEGIAFAVDYEPIPGATEAPYGRRTENRVIRGLLRGFFQEYRGTLTYHNAGYDASVLIYQLFMDHILDSEGRLRGLRHVLRDWHDTRIISYLATNSCSGNDNSLKAQAQEFAGNYAVEVTNILAVPLPQLLEYNLVDTLSTWFVKEKHWDRMVRDDQLKVYLNPFKPALVDIVQQQLTGMPVIMPRVLEVEGILNAEVADALRRIHANPIVQEFSSNQVDDYVVEKNLGYTDIVLKDGTVKRKVLTKGELSDKVLAGLQFNPNSGPQLQRLLFERLGLPVLGTTDTGLPETGTETMKALQAHTEHPGVLDLLKALEDLKAVAIIVTTFIPALKGAIQGPDGHHYLFGNFNLGGTVSGRLSSSEPNLQNIPVKGRYGKLIKSCFGAPPGWLFVGIDFNSLEDRISALTTRDPEKLKVYTDGFDGHCLRALAYYPEQIQGIDPDDPASVNSIAKLFPELRSESKTPTFALTYQGTKHTLMKNCGFSEPKATAIENRFKNLYKVSIQWVEDQLAEAARVGYVTAAFGLKVRTPLLRQVVRGNSRTPYQASAEGRTAGNALGQSWCLLNSRAMSETMGKVRASAMAHDIHPVAQIHDANYFLVRDDVEVLAQLNRWVVAACEWQDDPVIAHPEVKLGGSLSVFWPTWAKEAELPNGASPEEIRGIFENHYRKITEGDAK